MADFSNAPYFDDYDKTKGFHKVLFKPGFAVQARELNQLQTILQEQVSRFGDHVFKNGSVVVPGATSFEVANGRYVILNDATNSSTFAADIVDKVLVQDFSGSVLKARVHLAEKIFNKYVVGITYMNSATKDSGGQLVNVNMFDSATPISVEGGGFTISIETDYKDNDNVSIPSAGYSSFASVDKGVYYVDGYFVYVEAQKCFIEPFSIEPTMKVGFVIQKYIVDSVDDESLNDNAVGSPNESAPGADRLAINLVWTTRHPDSLESVADFIEIMSFENGRLRKYRANADYASLADTLARRTYDESGDYAVGGFDIQVYDHLKNDLEYGLLTASEGGDDNLFAVEVGPGKAYVKGYEVENLSNLYLEVDKARTENCMKFLNDNIQFNEAGEYIYISPGNHFFDLSKHPIIWLTDGVESTSNIIGYCVPKHVQGLNLSGYLMFKLFGSFYFNDSTQADFRKIGGWRIDALTNGPVLQVANLYNVTGGNYPIDANPLTSHAGYTPFAYDSAEKRLYLKKAMSAPIFDTSIAVVKSPATGYVRTMTFLENGTNISGDLVKLNVDNIKSLKDLAGATEIQADMTYSTTITCNGSGYGTFLYGGDGVFVGTPVAADVNNDASFFDSIVSIGDAGKRLTINNVAQANKTFSVTTVLRKNVAVKAKTLTEGTTVIANPSTSEMILAHKDIYRIKHIYMSANTSTPATITDTDVRENFTLVSNQTLDFYMNDGLKLKGSASFPTGQLLVVYDYLLHGTGDVFTVDSYVTLRDNPADLTDVTHIGRIPEFAYESRVFRLENYLDFRPIVRDGFHIIKASVTTGSNTATVFKDYRNVISAGSKVFAKGLATETTVTTVNLGTIVCGANFTFTGTVFLVVNTAAAASSIEPFSGADNVYNAIYGTSIQFDAQYFVERNDRVIITKGGDIKYLYGVPGTGKFPELPVDSMSLVKLTVSPYTKSAKFVKFQKDDNRRYTMRDIGRLEKRIESLEYYTSLTLKELDTKNLTITDAETGLDRFKSGFFVEDFRDMGVSKIYDGSFRATIDTQAGILKPFTDSMNTALLVNDAHSSNFVNTNGMITLPYTNAVMVEQPYATRTLTVNPYLVIDWNATLKLTPDTDRWLETQWQPAVTNVTELSKTIVNENTVNVPSTVVNESTIQIFDPQTWWQKTSVKETSNTSTTTTVSEKSSTNVNEVSTSSTRLLGSSIIPYMRAQVVRFKATGLKPETRYWASFDGDSVDAACRPVNPTTLVTGTYGQELVSDAMGTLWGDFSIRNNFFLCGTKTFTLTDVDLIANPDSGWECQASANYTSQGTLETKQTVINLERTTINTIDRTLTNNQVTRIERQTSVNTAPQPTPAPPVVVKVIDTPPQRLPIPVTTTKQQVVVAVRPEPVRVVSRIGPPRFIGSIATGGSGGGGGDPVAQSFDTYEMPLGAFITKLDLFFAKKDSSAPVWIQVRQLSQGLPVDDVIEGSVVSLSPSQVNVSADSTVPTSFVFEHPIFLEGSKEYCFVVLSNSSRYQLWISHMGEKVVNEDRVVGKQPSLGSLFKSQNSKTWNPEQMEDVKFTLHRAKFDTSVLGSVSFERTGTAKLSRLTLEKFSTTSGSKVVRVKHKNHGLQLNEMVTFFAETASTDTASSPVPAESLNGIPASNIYGDRIVKNIIDIDTYDIEVATAANKTGQIADSKRYIWADGNFVFNRFQFYVDNVQFSGCSSEYEVHNLSGKDFDGSQSPGVDLPPKLINVGDVIDMQSVGLIENTANENGTPSTKVVTRFSSTEDAVSPVFYNGTASMLLTGMSLNKPTTDNEANLNDGAAASKYYTQVVTLKNPATSMRIYTTESKQEIEGIEVYYRVSSDLSIESKVWVKLAPTASALVTDVAKYVEHEYVVGELEEFTRFQIKVVLKGTNSAKYPSVQDLRVIAVN